MSNGSVGVGRAKQVETSRRAGGGGWASWKVGKRYQKDNPPHSFWDVMYWKILFHFLFNQIYVDLCVGFNDFWLRKSFIHSICVTSGTRLGMIYHSNKRIENWNWS